MIQFDVLFQELGEVGLVQVIFILALSYYNLIAGFNALATVFISFAPTFRCNVPPFDNTTAYPNLTEASILNLTTPYNAADETYDGCYRYGYDLETCNGDLSCVNKSYSVIPCDVGYYYDRSMFTETVVTEFDLVCSNKYLDTLSTSLYYAGIMVGSLVFGNLADLLGRKVCCVVTYIGCLGCMFGLSFSRSITLYIVFRVGIAAFGYGSTIGTYVYRNIVGICSLRIMSFMALVVMEIVGKQWRTFFGIGCQMAFSVGFMVMGGIAYNWRNWHDMMLVASLLSIPFLIIAIIIPESPRWLFTSNKEKQGIKVTKLMARINRTTISEETWAEARKAGEEDNANKENERKYSSLDLFKSKGTAIITIKIMFNWFVNSFVYYGVSLNAGSLAGDLFVNNTLNGVLEILSLTFCILLMDRVGRRIMLTFLLLLSGVGLLASVVVNEYAGTNQALITVGLVFAFAAKFGISGSFAVIYNLTSELYPTVIRSNGVGVGSIGARVGGIVAPYVISLQDTISWLPNTIFGVFGVVAGILSMTFPETNGHEMMETIEEAEEFYKGKNIKADSSDEAEMEKKEQISYSNYAFDENSTQF